MKKSSPNKQLFRNELITAFTVVCMVVAGCKNPANSDQKTPNLRRMSQCATSINSDVKVIYVTRENELVRCYQSGILNAHEKNERVTVSFFRIDETNVLNIFTRCNKQNVHPEGNPSIFLPEIVYYITTNPECTRLAREGRDPALVRMIRILNNQGYNVHPYKIDPYKYNSLFLKRSTSGSLNKDVLAAYKKGAGIVDLICVASYLDNGRNDRVSASRALDGLATRCFNQFWEIDP